MQPQVQLWNVIEDGESEGGENQTKQKEQTNRSLVEVLVRSVSWAVPRDVVTQADGCQGDKDEVESVKNSPVRLKNRECC